MGPAGERSCVFLPFLGGNSPEGLEGLLGCPRWGAFERPWALRFTGATADLGPPLGEMMAEPAQRLDPTDQD